MAERRPSHHSAPASKFVTELINKLDRYIRGYDGQILPSTLHLCTRFGVSRPTMAAALRALRSAGVIDFHQGSAIRIAGCPQEPGAAQRAPAWWRLAELLSEEVKQGILRAGEPLPKISYLTANRNVSPNTVRAAYQDLLRREMIFRRGKRFFVGKRTRQGRPAQQNGSVVLVVARRYHAWQNICRSTRTEQFAQAFIQQAQGVGARILLVTREKSPVPIGALQPEQAVHTASSLGPRYLGSLVVGAADELTGLGISFGQLLRLRRPVVWFDANDEGRPGRVNDSNFARAHFSEPPAVDAALAYLVGYGHRSALYICSEPVFWQKRRAELLLASSRRRELPIRVHIHTELTVDEWTAHGAPVPCEHLRRLEAASPRGAAQLFDELFGQNDHLRSMFAGYVDEATAGSRYGGIVALVRACQSGTVGPERPELLKRVNGLYALLGLLPAFEHDEITAVISPNDSTLAYRHLPQIAALGLSVPRDLSAIAFDNSYRTTFVPVTSTDFGFGRLGYLTLHFIARDLPVGRTRGGDIPARPYVVAGETVGWPRKKPLRIATQVGV